MKRKLEKGSEPAAFIEVLGSFVFMKSLYQIRSCQPRSVDITHGTFTSNRVVLLEGPLAIMQNAVK